MQAKKGKVAVRRLSREEAMIISGFFRGIGLEDPYDYNNMVVLEVEGGGYYEVFYIEPRLNRLAMKIGALYSGGLNIGYISGQALIPSLHLARDLAPLCRTGKLKCSILTPRGEALFLYGRIVYEENVVKWVEGVSLVVGIDYEPLGWGFGEEAREKRIIRPIKDLGWYLRRGG
ncbi:MAG: hypothetical protein F7B17_06145 [Desulfurococcales archaeon]|nr:hypothetical protein [Desulfurococcales archaeon]